MKNKKILLILAVVSLCTVDILADDPLSGSSKNKLTYQELILKNRDKMATFEHNVHSLRERVDGLTTVVEGLSATINELQGRQSAPAVDNFSMLEAKVDKLSRECGKREEPTISKHTSQDNEIKKTNSTASSENRSSKNDISMNKSNSVIYSEGVRLFQKDKYSLAKERFTLTLDKGYKSASSSYYLGEIGYYSKKYSNAIFYFKKSVGINSKASYIDTLLLHTAISLEKTGDLAQAKVFYQTIIDGYPEKKSAKIALKKLKNL